MANPIKALADLREAMDTAATLSPVHYVTVGRKGLTEFQIAELAKKKNVVATCDEDNIYIAHWSEQWTDAEKQCAEFATACFSDSIGCEANPAEVFSEFGHWSRWKKFPVLDEDTFKTAMTNIGLLRGDAFRNVDFFSLRHPIWGYFTH